MIEPWQQRAITRYRRIQNFAHVSGIGADEWKKITNNPTLFNRLWRKMLGLPPDDMPPPIDIRR